MALFLNKICILAMFGIMRHLELMKANKTTEEKNKPELKHFLFAISLIQIFGIII